MELVEARLRVRRVSKSYTGNPVLSEVDFDLSAGEIHAIVGENGAGKSTLLKILSGAVAPDHGQVTLDGLELPPQRPDLAQRLGISVVYQEFTLIPDLSVSDNIFLGRERGRVWLDRRSAHREATAVLETLGVRLNPSTLVRELSVAHQQLIEIARALVTNAKVLILDEPSACLTAQDVTRLFGVLRDLRGRGLGIIYVSHRLDEVLEIADRITVLRDGRVVGTSQASLASREGIIRDMVGRELSEEFPARTAPPGAVVLEVTDLESPPGVNNVSLALRKGEILGVSGLVGAGRSSMALALFGRRTFSGHVRLGGVPVHFRSPHDALAGGLVYITEDRKGAGIFPAMSVNDNITIACLSAFSRSGLLREADRRQTASRLATEVGVRASSLTQPISTLSGGNQQKALFARFLFRPPAVLILDEPTRGVDVGARAEIYGIMNRLTSEGVAILLISSELPELLGMADRVMVMKDGFVTGEFTRAEVTAEAVMAAATGGVAA